MTIRGAVLGRMRKKISWIQNMGGEAIMTGEKINSLLTRILHEGMEFPDN